jgi:hypothetical protein
LTLTPIISPPPPLAIFIAAFQSFDASARRPAIMMPVFFAGRFSVFAYRFLPPDAAIR